MPITRPQSDIDQTREDPADDAVAIEDIEGEAIAPTDPPVDTALDDDEGGGDPVDPETGRPYKNTDAGVKIPPAGRAGGSDDG